MNTRTLARLLLGGALALEGATALRRFRARRLAFEAASRRAVQLGRPLIVVGDPDAGAHTRLMRAYECGDLCIDLHGCPLCRSMKAADLTHGPIDGIADDSAVVFVSCVLEYVSDYEAALLELRRIAGASENLFLVFVEPWTLTAAIYPGARWAGGNDAEAVVMHPVTKMRKLVTVSSIVALVALGAAGDRA